MRQLSGKIKHPTESNRQEQLATQTQLASSQTSFGCADGGGGGGGDDGGSDDHFDSWFRHHTSERHLSGANKVGGEGMYNDDGGGGDHADVLRDLSSFSSSSSDSSSSSSSDSEEETAIIVSPDDP